jgi:ABC-type transport system substrate-binding protein
VDHLLDLATAAATVDERRRYYGEAQSLIAIDAPVISLYARSNYVVAQADLTGISLSPLGDLAFLAGVSRTR